LEQADRRGGIADVDDSVMFENMTSFADRVRIKRTEETERLGLAGLEGQVFGYTTPSVTDVAVVGILSDDYAVNVHFDELDEEFWFADDLVEQIDRSPGTVISLEGRGTEWVRLPNGEWQEKSSPG
jgi:hypothetical protein